MTSGVTYKFTYAEREDDFLALEDSWSALIAANPDGNPFLTFEWQWSWWKSYAAKNTDTLKILIATNPLTDQIVGIAPLMLTKRAGLKSLRFIVAVLWLLIDMMERKFAYQVNVVVLRWCSVRSRK